MIRTVCDTVMTARRWYAVRERCCGLAYTVLRWPAVAVVVPFAVAVELAVAVAVAVAVFVMPIVLNRTRGPLRALGQ